MSTSVAATDSGESVAGTRLSLLGRFHLEQHGRAVRLRTRKEEGLLAYLVLHPGCHPREVLAELYWGETPEAQAKGSLRAALAELQYRFGLQGELEAEAMPLALNALAGDREGALELARQVCAQPASAGNARTRAVEIIRALDGDGELVRAAASGGTLQEIVRGALAGVRTEGTEVSMGEPAPRQLPHLLSRPGTSTGH